MKKKYSLKGKLCFQSVFLSGRKFKNKYSHIYVLAACENRAGHICRSREDSVKLGIIVTKRFGNAVQRNRAKRRFKAAFQKHVSFISSVCMVAKLSYSFNKIEMNKIEEDLAIFAERLQKYLKRSKTQR